MKRNDPEYPCGFCDHERFMHEHYKPRGLIEWLVVPHWFAGECLTPECDCKAFIFRSYRRKARDDQSS